MRRLAISVLALAALVGCTTQGQRQDAEPTPSASRSKDSAAAERSYTFRLPISHYSYSDAEYTLIQAAEHVLAKRCMARYSLTYQTPEESPAPPAVDRRYGLAEESSATRYGYRLPPEAPTPKGKPLTKDQNLVLHGNRRSAEKSGKLEYNGKEVPEAGCLGQAIRDFRKGYDHPAGVEAASRIAVQSHGDSLRSPDVQAAIGKWSACMRKAGYPYAMPLDPLGKFREGPVTSEEMSTAKADVACKRTTNLLDVWFNAESRIQTAMIGKDSKHLEELRDLHTKKVAAAKKIVAEG